MKAIVDGSHPPAPIHELMGFDLVEAEEGRTLFSSIPGPEHLNPIGVVHGGFAGLLLDSCMGAAVHTTCQAVRARHLHHDPLSRRWLISAA